jgi:sugar phosphate permease
MAGIIVVSLGALALFVVRRHPTEMGQLPDGADPAEAGQEAAPNGPAPRMSRVLRNPTFWLLALGSVLSISAVGGVTQNLPLFLADISKSNEEARRAAAIYPSIVLLTSIAGRLSMGYLADRFRKKHVMLATFLLIGVSIPLLPLSREHPELLYVFAVLFGFGLGADYLLIPLMTAECFGLVGLSRILGIIITSDSVGESLMPWAVARIREGTGSYDIGFLLLTGVALLGAVAILGIRYRDGAPISRQQLSDASTEQR